MGVDALVSSIGCNIECTSDRMVRGPEARPLIALSSSNPEWITVSTKMKYRKRKQNSVIHILPSVLEIP